MSKAVRIAVDQLIYDLEHRPVDFSCNQFRLIDNQSLYEYWVGNMFFDAGVYSPFKMPFGFVHGWRFHSALNKWKAFTMIQNSRQS